MNYLTFTSSSVFLRKKRKKEREEAKKEGSKEIRKQRKEGRKKKKKRHYSLENQLFHKISQVMTELFPVITIVINPGHILFCFSGSVWLPFTNSVTSFTTRQRKHEENLIFVVKFLRPTVTRQMHLMIWLKTQDRLAKDCGNVKVSFPQGWWFESVRD